MDTLLPSRVNLLVLKGVYPHDFNTPDATEAATANTEIVYQDLPKHFTGVASWPTTSNLRCWECDQIPTGYPKFVPRHPEYAPDMTCEVYGHFCEWNCVMSFIHKETPRERQWDEIYNTQVLESKFSGKRRERIPRAPPKYIMKAYCGSKGVSPQEYRERMAEQDRIYSAYAHT